MKLKIAALAFGLAVGLGCASPRPSATAKTSVPDAAGVSAATSAVGGREIVVRECAYPVYSVPYMPGSEDPCKTRKETSYPVTCDIGGYHVCCPSGTRAAYSRSGDERGPGCCFKTIPDCTDATHKIGGNCYSSCWTRR